jgi:hypothetical protein
MIDVTIRMPADWFDHFWGWWLDGGGDDGFKEGIDTADCEEGVTWSKWDRGRRLLVHAKDQATLKTAFRPRPE